jgi:hypothetical protein
LPNSHNIEYSFYYFHTPIIIRWIFVLNEYYIMRATAIKVVVWASGAAIIIEAQEWKSFIFDIVYQENQKMKKSVLLINEESEKGRDSRKALRMNRNDKS